MNAHYEFSVNAAEEFLLLFQGKILLRLQSDVLDELDDLRGIVRKCPEAQVLLKELRNKRKVKKLVDAL